MKCSLEKWGRAPIILRGHEHPSFWGLEHPFSRRAWALIIQRAIKWRTGEQMQNEHERNKFMKCSLEKMRSRTHYFWGLEHPLFWGLEHPFSRRARALIIQRGTSTHCSKTNKQRASEQLQSGHERNKFMKCCLEKMRARTHYFRGREHPSFWVLEHPLF